MVIQLLALSFPGFLKEALPQTEFKYLYEFQRALAVLVFGLSGLRTWEVVKERNGNGNQHKNSNPGGGTGRAGDSASR